MHNPFFFGGTKHLGLIILTTLGIGLSCGLSSALSQTTAIVDILNPANAAGDIVVSKGTAVEVEFDVTGDSSKNDELQLVRVDNNAVVSKKKRGSSTIGTVNLHTNAENAIATLRVDYVHVGSVAASAPDEVVVVADEGSVVLSEQIADLQSQLNAINAAQGTAITQLQTDLVTAQGIIATLQTDLATTQATITSQASTIVGLQASLSQAQIDIVALQATPLGTLPTDVANNAQDILNLQGQVNSLPLPTPAEATFLTDLSQYMSVQTGTINDLFGPHVIFEGANVHIRSGSGLTGIPIAKGNLIIGYNEVPNWPTPPANATRTGSHNLVIGSEHYYGSTETLVSGFQNLTRHRSVILGGRLNEAAGSGSVIAGGDSNIATSSGNYQFMGGGNVNSAGGSKSAIIGGQGNSTTNQETVVIAGSSNIASGSNAAVFGGGGNESAGSHDTVTGGGGNLAHSSCCAGSASISGGSQNKAFGPGASVLGGFGNEANSPNATVAGGFGNIAGNTASCTLTASGATVSGGRLNEACGSNATVSGGALLQAIGTDTYAD